MVETSVTKALYKIELYTIKIIPFIIMLCYVLNSILSYFKVDIIMLSTIGGLSILTWLFLYLSSFVFKFCIYHRLPLYYILVADIINYYDYMVGIEITDRGLLMLHMIIVGVTLLLIVYFKFKQHESANSR